ncbi:uncharacterized protein FOBCDRAFT_148992 [Fusarium oxysporum Fo47]|uniref:uncharacterized protein n=1 Tax=Fusarium oxysporum Fo47 TaxID=660027 RepID=UPI002869AE58|nr:uncharacterized protein FOBCDRAFT_148992 [Fusarium oxysporum Fo47]WJG37079.1 hypothetical protein FOBCDRAFT_148992 [Fusarium oxysporum Fo47]
MQTYFAFVASLLAATPVLAKIIPVTIYDEVSGQGASETLQLTSGTCRDLETAWGNRMASFLKPQDAKCWIYKGNSCVGGPNNVVSYVDDQAFICFLNDQFEDQVNSIKCW